MKLLFVAIVSFFSLTAFPAAEVGKAAPLFNLQDQDGKTFSLEERRGKGWTVLFFYPKAGTPGCTKQACAFRDSIQGIRSLGADVFGISADTVEAQNKFHKEHKLSFRLLADPKLEAISKFGVKMTGVTMAKRWTFILDPNLNVRSINDKVDPVMDPSNAVQTLKDLQAKASVQ